MATLLACLCVATKLQSTDMTILDRGLVKDLQQLKMNGDQQLAQCIWAAVLER
jgi:hypothetical protein